MAKDEAGFISILRHMVNSHIEHPNQDGYNEWIDPTGTFDRFYGIDRTGQVPLHRAIRNSQAAINGDRQVYCARFVFGVLLALVSLSTFRNLLSFSILFVRDSTSSSDSETDSWLVTFSREKSRSISTEFLKSIFRDLRFETEETLLEGSIKLDLVLTNETSTS